MARPSVDEEWASSLVGLELNVPNNWWTGCRGTHRHHGRIDAVNCDDPHDDNESTTRQSTKKRGEDALGLGSTDKKRDG